jgi:hypothetical protein
VHPPPCTHACSDRLCAARPRVFVQMSSAPPLKALPNSVLKTRPPPLPIEMPVTRLCDVTADALPVFSASVRRLILQYSHDGDCADDGSGAGGLPAEGLPSAFPFFEVPAACLTDGDLTVTYQCRAACPGDGSRRVPTYNGSLVAGGAVVGHLNVRCGAGARREMELWGGNLGYAVDEKARGHRYAARAIALFLPVAQRHGLSTVTATCAPDNAASRRTAELAGGVFDGVFDVPQWTALYQDNGVRLAARFRWTLRD